MLSYVWNVCVILIFYNLQNCVIHMLFCTFFFVTKLPTRCRTFLLVCTLSCNLLYIIHPSYSIAHSVHVRWPMHLSIWQILRKSIPFSCVTLTTLWPQNKQQMTISTCSAILYCGWSMLLAPCCIIRGLSLVTFGFIRNSDKYVYF